MKRIPIVLFVLFVAAALLGARGDADTPNEGGAMPPKQKIVPCLWFRDAAEEAVRFYCSILPDAEILGEMRAGPKGPLVSATFRLAGQEFLALNGNPGQPFTDAASLLVRCAGQEEVDRLWAALTAGGGEPGRCGWLKDRYGVSWQVIPTVLLEMLGDKDPARARRVAEAMLAMDKIDIARLKRAYEGR